MAKVCQFCDKDVSKGRVYGLGAVPENSSEGKNFYQIILWVIQEKNFLGLNLENYPSLKERDSRKLCSPCATAFKNVYENALTLRKQFSGNGQIAQVVASEIAEKMGSLDVTRSQLLTSLGDDDGTTSIHNVQSQQETTREVTYTLYRSPIVKWKPSTPLKKKIFNAQKSNKTKTTFMNTIRQMIRGEMEFLTNSSIMKSNRRGDSFLPTDEEIDTVLQSECPLTRTVLNALFQKGRNQIFSNEMRLAIGVACHVANRNCNGLQKSVAVNLFKNQASKNTYIMLSRLGISITYEGTLKVMDTMRQNFDADVINWKHETSDFLANPSDDFSSDFMEISEDSMEGPSRNFSQLFKRGSDMSISELEQESTNVIRKKAKTDSQMSDSTTSIDEESLTEGGEKRLSKWTGGFRGSKLPALSLSSEGLNFKGMTLTFDNINRLIKKRDYHSQMSNKMLNCVSAFAVFNRIPIKAEKLLNRSYKKFGELDPNSWLINDSDVENIKQDHETEILKILCRYLKLFAPLRSSVNWTTDHKYSSELSQKSTMINLGIYPYDENKLDDMLKILKRFDKYVPRFPNGEKLEVGVFGDGGSTNSMKNAQNHFDSNCDEWDKSHRGLVALNSPWHRKLLLLQDDFNLLMKNTSNTFGDGTLANFKSRFGHKQAKMVVKEDFNHSFKFYRFVIEAYIIAKAVQLLDFEVKELDYIPPDLVNQSKEYLLELAKKISHLICEFSWHDILREIQQTKYCVCSKTFEESTEALEDWVGCDNFECVNLTWYHRSCLSRECQQEGNLFNRPPPPEAKVTKKETTKSRGLPRGRPRGSSKAHSFSTNVTRVTARNLKRSAHPKDAKNTWFCTKECEKLYRDRKFRYSKGIMFSGLNFLAYHSSIRSGDGERMKTYMKLQMPQLMKNNHTIYFKITHRLLGYMNGAAPEHIINDLMNNSTFNWSGGKGRNMGLDLCNELLNRVLDGIMKRMMGNMSMNALERASQSFQFVDEVSKEFKKVFDIEDHPNRKTSEFQKYATDFNEAIKIILDGDEHGDLLTARGERYHEGFEDFVNTTFYLQDSAKMRDDIITLSQREDALNFFASEKRDIHMSQLQDPVILGEDATWLRKRKN